MFRSLLIASSALVLVSCGSGEEAAEAPATELSEAELATAGLSGAPNWEIDRGASRIGFRATQNGNSFEGSFGRWNAGIILNPEAPEEEGEIEAVIDLSSADAGTSERNEALPQEGWFNAAVHPTATFRSADISSTGEGSYVADGTLTIKGVNRDVSMPFTLTIDEAGRAVADGSVMLNRSDFGIGQGEFEDDRWVGYEVEVLLHMEATPAG
ncbi:YceI family protein [Parvularcula maris]|uniref:YceI family protein n=1 Tax=Parvularcula maris TaxID=2965077 RepID=A0A9X2L967_9PROT|nr:YceI family protein [Parvularcula maris]MCQ8185380.1 YceI family protein [Parvularcula maris]